MISKRKLKALYINEKRPQREIAEMYGLSQPDVSLLCKKYKLKRKSGRYRNHGTKWTEKQDEYLIERYGVDGAEEIAKFLGRTVISILERKHVLELGSAKDATEYINATDLANAIGVSKSTTSRWINNKGLPAEKKTITAKLEIHRIDIEEFWKWCKENLKLMRWENYERNSLGKEPEWLDAEIKKYNKKREKNSRKDWTDTEIAYLRGYYKQGLTNKEIADKLGRSSNSIAAKIHKLEVENKEVHLPWKEEEIKQLLEMRENKIPFYIIADELGRGMKSVNMKYHRITKQMQG